MVFKCLKRRDFVLERISIGRAGGIGVIAGIGAQEKEILARRIRGRR